MSACASTTKFTDTWTPPDAAPAPMQRITVVFLSDDPGLRRRTEETIADEVKKATVVPFSAVMDQPTTRAIDKNALGDFDGAVTLRVVGPDITTTWVPGSFPSAYDSFSRYYQFAWPQVYGLNATRMDPMIRVEANVYSLPDDKLLWSGLTEPIPAWSLSGLAGVLAETVAAKMREQQLLP